jgi:hypothetical protein
LDIVVLGASALTFAIVSGLPAGQVRIGSHTASVRYTHLLGAGYIFLALVLLCAAIALVEMFLGRQRSVVGFVGLAMCGVTVLLANVTLEGANALIPERLLPTTIRRFSLGLGASVWAWVAFAALVVMCLSSIAVLRPMAQGFARAPREGDREFRIRLGGTAITVSGIVMLGFARTVPIAQISWLGGSVEADPWALPWIGPLSLVLLLVIVASTVFAAFDQTLVPASLAGGAAGWVVAATSAWFAATSGLVIKSGLISWAVKTTGPLGSQNAVRVSGHAGATLAVVAGSVCGLGFAVQLAARPT